MPRRKNSWVDDLVLAPWWVSTVLALLAYAMLPSVLPTAIVNSGLVAFITVLLLAISAVSALRSLRTKLLVGAQTSLDSLRDLPWKRFEEVLGEAYRRQGYQVKEMLPMVASTFCSAKTETSLWCNARDGGANLYPCRLSASSMA